MNAQRNIVALVYKEWIKLRYGLWLPLLVISIAVAYSYFTLSDHKLSHGGLTLWRMIIVDGEMPFEHLRYLPLLTGVWISALQWWPEVSQKRLKLFFHLAVSHHVSLLLSLSIGVALLSTLFFIMVGGQAYVMSLFVPREVVSMTVLTLAPWCVAGVIAYISCTLLLLERRPLRRLVYVFMGTIFVRPLLKQVSYGYYQDNLILFGLIALAFMASVVSVMIAVKRDV